MRPYYKSGDPDGFWARVDSSAGPDKCWPWTGATSHGYGSVNWLGKIGGAHHVAYELTHGPLGVDECACHTCDNNICCNPSHLFRGTRAVNNADRDAKGRQSGAKGEANSHAKLTRHQVDEIRILYASGGITTYQLAKEYGVYPTAIQKIIRRDTWK